VLVGVVVARENRPAGRRDEQRVHSQPRGTEDPLGGALLRPAGRQRPIARPLSAFYQVDIQRRIGLGVSFLLGGTKGVLEIQLLL
jgi:hypothetical protein